MSGNQEHLEKIEGLVNSAGKFNEMSFRMVLEGLVNKGGEEAEYLVVRYINARDMDLSTRINIIRVVGYLQGPHFLIPLKKLIDSDENVQLKKEAVISVSKYNDRRALNILNHALANIKNPLLLETINNEIAKIKKNNPVFALLPRFLKGEKDYKDFRTTIDILKRILTPTDATIFSSYLNCGRRLIEDGSFDILCATGDESHQKAIFDFYQSRFDVLPCITKPKCEELLHLTGKIKVYFLRNPLLIDMQLDNLGTQYYFIKDIRVQRILLSIFCSSRELKTIEFVGKIYDTDPGSREIITREYSGNDAAADLLFEKYQTATEELKIILVQSLLNSHRGIEYFFEKFPSLDLEEKKTIVNYLPYGGTLELGPFIERIFQSDQPELRAMLLTKMKQYGEFSVKSILFDPSRLNEFASMEQEYLDTVTQLFPITTVKSLFDKIAYDELPANKIKKFLEIINEVVPNGFAFNFKDKYLVNGIVNAVLLTGKPELNSLLLEAFRHIRTFDPASYSNISEAMALFNSRRGQKISNKEADEMRKVRRNLDDMVFDIRAIEEGLRTFSRLFGRPTLDFEQLANFFNRNALSIALNIDPVILGIENRLVETDMQDSKRWIQLFGSFPMIGFKVRDSILKIVEERKNEVSPDLLRLHQSLPKEATRVILRLSDKQAAAMLREQCHEIIPGIVVTNDSSTLQDGDILLCDGDTLKDFILTNTLPSRKLFLLLDKRSDFVSFKSYNPRLLLKPFSGYRILKEILKEIYI